MCINCQFKPIIPLNEKANSYRKILSILLFIYLIIIIFKIIYQIDDLFSKIIEIFLFIFAYIMCHYILCLIFIFLTLFDLLFTLFFLGQIIQNKILNPKNKDDYDSRLVIFIYCIILIIYLFLSYREFKAISREQMNNQLINTADNSDNNKNTNGISLYKNEYNNYNSNNLNNNNKKKFIPFSGKGYTVGGN